MTTADLTRAPGGERTATRASSTEGTGWLLRASGVSAVLAGAAAVVVSPGLRGNASERVVVWVDWVTAGLAYLLLGVLSALLLWGALELARFRTKLSIATRVALTVGGSVTFFTASMAWNARLPPWMALFLVAAASVSAIFAAYDGVLRPHTRGPALLLLTVAFAALARLGAWEVAARANDHADLSLFRVSRALATAGIGFEALGQVIAVTWLGARSRLAGQLGSTAALLLALAVTWGVSRGVRAEAAPWQYVLHTALADAPGLPPPYGLDAIATFLVPASLLLALVAALQPHPIPTAVAASVALALVSRGSFDAPLRALAAVVSAIWIALASGDDVGMWRSLLGDAGEREASPAFPATTTSPAADAEAQAQAQPQD